MTSAITKQEASLEKERAPVLYKQLHSALWEYDNCHNNSLRKALYSLGLFSKDLAAQRTTLAQTLKSKLNGAEFSYLNTLTAKRASDTGSVQISQTLSKMKALLNNFKNQNDTITDNYNNNRTSPLPAGSGNLAALLEKYIAEIEQSIQQLDTYLDSQDDGQFARKVGRYAIDVVRTTAFSLFK